MKHGDATAPEQVIDHMEAAFNRNDLDGLVALFAQRGFGPPRANDLRETGQVVGFRK